MVLNDILLLVASVLIAAGLSFYQYLYKAKIKNRIFLILAFLRFLTLFSVFLLLVNPLIRRKTLEINKPPLAVVLDNSSSIVNLKAKASTLALYRSLSTNSALADKFDLQFYQFDSELLPFSSLNFKGRQTNIEEVAKGLQNTHKNTLYPTILISDGNQTTGNDYSYAFDVNNAIYPIVVGDTTSYLDLKISQLNVNKYAFLKNQFPVEVFLDYSGTKNVNAKFEISQGSSILKSQTISFSRKTKSAVIKLLLPANQLGLQIYKATVSSKEPEKNRYNNSANFAVEIISQKTNIALISERNHPDIGALKRAIESNVQRKVTVLKPNDIKSLADYSFLIYYQPTTRFKSVFDNNKKLGLNCLIITGNSTDFNFLNQIQSDMNFKMSNQKEEYLAHYVSSFTLFAQDNIGFEQFPALENSFGTILAKDNLSVLLSSKIRNIDTNAPLLAFSENQGRRSAYLFGENSWKWRMHSYVSTKSFAVYDGFIDKIMHYLSSTNSRKSLIVNYENFYNSGEAIEISAQYFNKNYEFDEKANLTISVTNVKTKKNTKYDLLKGNGLYKVNLGGLSPGKYTFQLTELNSKSTFKGLFEIIDFDIEKQFVNPDRDKLGQLATQTKGKLYYPNQVETLINTLLADESYRAIQKEIIRKTPLIDSFWLLIVITVLLALEWFIRKYHGML